MVRDKPSEQDYIYICILDICIHTCIYISYLVENGWPDMLGPSDLSPNNKLQQASKQYMINLLASQTKFLQIKSKQNIKMLNPRIFNAIKYKRRLCNSRRSPWFGTTTAQAQRDGSCEDLHGLIERCLGHILTYWRQRARLTHTNQKEIWQTSENNWEYVSWNDDSSGDYIVPRLLHLQWTKWDLWRPIAPMDILSQKDTKTRWRLLEAWDQSHFGSEAFYSIELWRCKHLEPWSDARLEGPRFKVKLSATLHACFTFSAAWLDRRFPSLFLSILLKLCNPFLLTSFIHWCLSLHIWQTRNPMQLWQGQHPPNLTPGFFLHEMLSLQPAPTTTNNQLYRSQVWNSVKNNAAMFTFSDIIILLHDISWYYHTKKIKGTPMKPMMCEVDQKSSPSARINLDWREAADPLFQMKPDIQWKYRFLRSSRREMLR